MDVNALVRDIIQREGALSDDPDDRGHQLRAVNGDKWDSSVTKYGITQYTLSEWLGRQATVEEVLDLTVAGAKEIYLAVYYREPGIDLLPEDLQALVMDMGVNHGVRTASKLLQELVGQAGYWVEPDGKIGPLTAKAAEMALEEYGCWLVNALVEKRLRYYMAIIERNPSQGKFWRGWSARAQGFLVEGHGDEISRELVREFG